MGEGGSTNGGTNLVEGDVGDKVGCKGTGGVEREVSLVDEGGSGSGFDNR